MSNADFAELRKLNREFYAGRDLRVLYRIVQKISFMILGDRVRLIQLEARIDVLEKTK